MPDRLNSDFPRPLRHAYPGARHCPSSDISSQDLPSALHQQCLSQFPAPSLQLQFKRQCRCKLKSLGILSRWSLELFHSLRSHIGCRIALKFDNKFYPLLDLRAMVRGGAISHWQTFGLLGIFVNLLLFSWSLQKSLTERSMKEYLHIVNLIIGEDVICLNLGKSQSKLFKEIAHIFEASSGVIKIEIMYIGPIVV